jgi:hypothetical protein
METWKDGEVERCTRIRRISTRITQGHLGEKLQSVPTDTDGVEPKNAGFFAINLLSLKGL